MLEDEIERRQFVEAKVQKYVKRLVRKNNRMEQFLEGQKENQEARLFLK